MVQISVHISEDHKKRLNELPRQVSFSKLIRDNFDLLLKDYEKPSFVVKAVR